MSSHGPSSDPVPARGGAYDYEGPIRFEYSPELDRDADPGEIVWAWVAYEEDDAVGKDRPVAVIGRAHDDRLVVLMLSSKDHAGDQRWISIGTGPWDRQGRESWVRRDRVLAVHAQSVRREGAVIAKATYDTIVTGMGGAAPAAATRPSGQPARTRLMARLRTLTRRRK